MNGEVSEDLAIRFDTGGFDAFDEARVGQTFGAGSGIDALGPQTAELAFAFLTVAVFVLLSLADSVLGVAIELRAETAETLGAKQNALAARAACGGVGSTWHVVLSWF